ncbi:hypothetical protein KQX54_006646 [Cotesia glomerata]|uniref:Uncharacterized protein n=1 Tax=Cotesia glomerata TaxID=32391 RepID=A0AAV7IPU7_COTGL|nr:hypothetical protein KQX54_006646 [Cotesia glomerata]
MPRRKRGGDLASSAAKRWKQKESRRNETEEEHEARLQNQRTTRLAGRRETGEGTLDLISSCWTYVRLGS